MNRLYQVNFKKSYKVLCAIALLLTFSACSKKITFPVSDTVPAAEAVVTVDKDSNQNYEVDLEVKNLAQPDRLRPSRRHYFVWMVTKQNGTINLGKLDINRKNNGELKTNTPYKPVRIFITAEDDDRPVVPSTQVVLNSGDFKA